MKYSILFLLLCILNGAAFPQDKDVIEQLKNIEKGNIDNARSALVKLKNEFPGNPSVLFLEGVLTGDGSRAMEIYEKIHGEFPKSTFADASLFRMFSYYYASGLYKKAEATLKQLKAEYPSSPYVQAADRTIPEEELPEQKPPVKIEKEQPVKKDSASFTVQAGAFLNINNAKTLKKNLETDGFASEITTKEVGGSILNVVLAGRFYSEKEADVLVQHLDKKYRLKGRIVPATK